MKYLLAALLIALPLQALAQDRIPTDELRKSYAQCTSRCENQGRSYSYCSAMCSCMTRQMDLHWTAADFRRRYRSLLDPPRDAATRGELERMADRCHENAT